MITKEIINKARELAEKEIQLHGLPNLIHLELSNQKGQKIAKNLGADEKIVMIGTLLMDVKLGQCFKENRVGDHINESVKFTKEFLKSLDLDLITKSKIINCVEAHHGTKKYACKEAEICANADSYRFIHPKGVMTYIQILSKRGDLKETITQVEYKLEEKNKVLSLSACKEELGPYYIMFKEMIKKAREE